MNPEIWAVTTKEVHIEDDETGEMLARFKIDHDEHGWRWWLIYEKREGEDEPRQARVGRF